MILKYIRCLERWWKNKVHLRKKIKINYTVAQFKSCEKRSSNFLWNQVLSFLQISIIFCHNSSLEEQQFSTVVTSWRLNALKIWHILSKNVMSSLCTLNKPNFLLVTKVEFLYYFFLLELCNIYLFAYYIKIWYHWPESINHLCLL